MLISLDTYCTGTAAVKTASPFIPQIPTPPQRQPTWPFSPSSLFPGIAPCLYLPKSPILPPPRPSSTSPLTTSRPVPPSPFLTLFSPLPPFFPHLRTPKHQQYKPTRFNKILLSTFEKEERERGFEKGVSGGFSLIGVVVYFGGFGGFGLGDRLGKRVWGRVWGGGTGN